MKRCSHTCVYVCIYMYMGSKTTHKFKKIIGTKCGADYRKHKEKF